MFERLEAPVPTPESPPPPRAGYVFPLVGLREVGVLAETFRVLGDPTRVRILDALSHSELCVGDLAGTLGLTESAVSHQLRLLRGHRIVRPRREGRLVYYALDDEHIISLFHQGLRHVQEDHLADAHPAVEADRGRQ